MFAVFGKSKKKEYENSFNKIGVKVKDEEKTFNKDTGCYQISAGRFYPPCLSSNSQASS